MDIRISNIMDLQSNYIQAFYETAKRGSTTEASKALAITQSALSQRIKALEDRIESTLFIRNPHGMSLTEIGEKLFQYCKIKNGLDEEFLANLNSTNEDLRGTIRIGAFSSVLRSVVIPALAEFLRHNSLVHCEFIKGEMNELPEMLKRNEVDLIFLDFHLNKSEIEEDIVGKEEYVVISSSKFSCPKNIFLDHGPLDNATESYFNFQGELPKSFRRSFMGDVYGILDGVELGLGRAVMSKHLVIGNKKFKITKYPKKYFRDITLNYYKRSYTPKLLNEVIINLKKNCKNFLT